MSSGRPILVLGVDNPLGLGVVRDLGMHGHPVIALGRDADALGFHSRWCAHRVLRERDPERLVEQIEALSRAHGATALVATAESDIVLVNRYRDRLERTVRCALPDAAAMERVLDKALTLEAARAVGIDVPRTLVVQPGRAVAEQLEEVALPVILKWADPNAVAPALRGAGLPLVKCEYIDDAAALETALARYAAVGAFPLVQEYLPGFGLGQFFLLRDGEPVLEFQHRRLHEFPPDGGTSSLCESVDPEAHGALREQSLSLLRALGFDGVAMVEYRHDPVSGRCVLMEVNGRFWGSFPLALAAGVPFASGLVADEEALATLNRRYRPGIRARFVTLELHRLRSLLLDRRSLRNPALRGGALMHVLRFLLLFLDPRMHYFVFRLDDPAPALHDVWRVLRRGRGR